jgi:hypothetical protein
MSKLEWREIPASLPEPERNPLIGELSEASSRTSNTTGRLGRGTVKGDRRAGYGGPCRDWEFESFLLQQRVHCEPDFLGRGNRAIRLIRESCAGPRRHPLQPDGVDRRYSQFRTAVAGTSPPFVASPSLWPPASIRAMRAPGIVCDRRPATTQPAAPAPTTT